MVLLTSSRMRVTVVVSMCEVSVTVLAATHWEGLGTRLMVSS